MRSYTDFIESKKMQYGNFTDKELKQELIPYFESQQRIEIEFLDKDNNIEFTKRGRIGVTSGWQPCFLLMLTTRSMGSSWTLTGNLRVKRVITL